MATAELSKLIESLSPENKEKVVEYAQLLRSKRYFLDWKEAVEREDVNGAEEARKRLSELFKK